jgi:hypothetical protein
MKKEEELSCEKSEENQPEENGISNRHFSTTFIPPLTNVTDHFAARRCGVEHLPEKTFKSQAQGEGAIPAV